MIRKCLRPTTPGPWCGPPGPSQCEAAGGRGQHCLPRRPRRPRPRRGRLRGCRRPTRRRRCSSRARSASSSCAASSPPWPTTRSSSLNCKSQVGPEICHVWRPFFRVKTSECHCVQAYPSPHWVIMQISYCQHCLSGNNRYSINTSIRYRF